MTNVTLPVVRNPALNKLQSGYTAGTLLTINGSGFGTRTNGQALYFSQGANLSADPYCSRLQGTYLDTSHVSTSSTHGASVVIDLASGGIATSCFNPNGLPVSGTAPLVTYVEKYYDWDTMSASNLDTPFDPNVPGTYRINLKHYRVWNPAGTADVYCGSPAYNSNPASNATVLPPSSAPSGYRNVESINGGNQAAYPPNTPLNFQWMQDEFILVPNSANGVADGVIRQYRNGVNIDALGSYGENIATRDATYPTGFTRAFLDEVSNSNTTNPFNTYYRAIIYDDELRGLYLGTASTLAACTNGTGKLVRQPTASWADGKIIYAPVNNFGCTYYYVRTGLNTWLSTNGVAL